MNLANSLALKKQYELGTRISRGMLGMKLDIAEHSRTHAKMFLELNKLRWENRWLRIKLGLEVKGFKSRKK